MDEFALAAFREREARQILKRRTFYLHLSVYVAVNLMLIAIWALVGGGFPWFLFPLMGWGIGLVAHGAYALGSGRFLGEAWQERKIREEMEREQQRSH